METTEFTEGHRVKNKIHRRSVELCVLRGYPLLKFAQLEDAGDHWGNALSRQSFSRRGSCTGPSHKCVRRALRPCKSTSVLAFALRETERIYKYGLEVRIGGEADVLGEVKRREALGADQQLRPQQRSVA